jgi:uncharacterized membrane protein
MALYFLVLFALPSMPRLRRRFTRRVVESDVDPQAPKAASPPGTRSMITGLAVAAGLCAVGYGLAEAFHIPSAGILIITALTVTLATLLPGPLGSLAGAHEVGVLLMQIFFAVIGASASIGLVVRHGLALFLFALAILAVHLLFILTAGLLLRLDLAEVVIASNANMGGPTTAAAMAVARRWEALVLPAVLCGTLGYATATFVGVALGHALR